MRKKILTIVDDIALSKLQVDSLEGSDFTHKDWIRLIRTYLRMTQAELAKRANITQANLVAIESGKAEPRVSTLRRIYTGLSCNLRFEPHPRKPLEEILRGRARVIALQRLKKTMGTMALEEQAADKETFKKLLEKRTDDILSDPRERLWRKSDDG
ncbi:helix-turn-helix domain-containing protein [Nitrospira sp. M1]